MNAPESPSPLAAVEMAPRDPILGLIETYNADKNPAKVNLGVGVYYDDNGKIPLLDCVRQAENALAQQAAPRGYLPIDGIADYDKAVQRLIFGDDCAALADGRVVTVQALGGTGGLRIGADFLKRLAPDSQVWISNPSWENHLALFESAGFKVNTYPYYDAATHGVNFAGMLAALNQMPQGSVVVLHACCHNPTGVDLTAQQWDEVISLVRSRHLMPFLDFAYQGFGDGIAEDAAAVRRFAATPGPLFVSSSFSKSFSLYGERVGAVSVVVQDGDQGPRVLSQLKRLVRTNYSNPPTHGGKVVAAVLTTPALRTQWEQELAHMRDRIKAMRVQLVEKLRARVPDADFSFVLAQRGMFSYSGLTREQVIALREKFGVYAIESGRICVAALNSRNIDYSVESIASVLKAKA